MIEVYYSFSSCCNTCRAYRALKEAADEGHAGAEVELAFGYLLGIYLPLDTKTAKAILMKHAQAGNPKAQAVSHCCGSTSLG